MREGSGTLRGAGALNDLELVFEEKRKKVVLGLLGPPLIEFHSEKAVFALLTSELALK